MENFYNNKRFEKTPLEVFFFDSAGGKKLVSLDSVFFFNIKLESLSFCKWFKLLTFLVAFKNSRCLRLKSAKYSPFQLFCTGPSHISKSIVISFIDPLIVSTNN